MIDAIATEVFRKLLAQVTEERRRTRARQQKREATRRMWPLEQLPMPRVYMHGPKWRRFFDVQERPIAEIDPEAAKLHRPGRKLLWFSLEDDVRERVLEPLGFDRYAEWSDPRERLGL
jgi:hypothetical protein